MAVIYFCYFFWGEFLHLSFWRKKKFNKIKLKIKIEKQTKQNKVKKGKLDPTYISVCSLREA